MQPAVRLDPATGSAYVEIGRLRDRNAHPSKGSSEPLRRPQPASRNGTAEAQRLDFTLARRKIHVSFVEAARKNAVRSQQLGRLKDRKPHNARKAAFNAFDENACQPLNAVPSRLVVRFARARVGDRLFGRYLPESSRRKRTASDSSRCFPKMFSKRLTVV